MGHTGKGSGLGKVVLFGDHFVVYGLPAIVSAIKDRTDAMIESADRYELIDNRPATEGYKEKKKDEMRRSMQRLLDFMRIEKKTPVKITLSGNLFCASGIGASAAMSTSIARAFSDYLGLRLDDEEINRIAYEGEKGAVGPTTSGIDNTCSTFGGIIWFRRDVIRGENTIEFLKIKNPMKIVLGNSGITSLTREIVSEVRRAKQEDPKKFEKLFVRYVSMVKGARDALEDYNIEKLGRLMDDHHKILQEMSLSCKELDLLVDISKKNGAQGAKMTGTGRGGYVIALTSGARVQEKVAKAMEENGFKCWKTEIG